MDSGGYSTGEPTTLKSYTDRKGASIADQKVSNFKNGGSAYLNLRNNGSTTKHIDFLQNEGSFGSTSLSDWKLTTTSDDDFHLVRKRTPVLGIYENEVVVEFKSDGDVNIVKESGLKVDGVDVVVKTDLAELICSSRE